MPLLIVFQFLIGRLKTDVIDRPGHSKPDFNSLQVDSKLIYGFIHPHRLLRFQFLIGRLKTHLRTLHRDVAHSVISIPYRQTQNSYTSIIYRLMRYVFQFLIGRLKTRYSLTSAIFSSVFQFLIGRLKTVKFILACCLHSSFQFLIGRLKTMFCSNRHDTSFLISIPYRQTQNCKFSHVADVIDLDFNSLQVDSKRIRHPYNPFRKN